MNLSLQSKTGGGTPDARHPQGASVPLSPDDPFTPLDHLVRLLQGGAEPAIADAGIAAFPAAHLERISANAKQEADLCHEGAELLLDLLESSLENGCAPAPEAMLRMVRQLRRLACDQRRWHDLADNASYYRDNPHVAARIAAGPHGTVRRIFGPDPAPSPE